MADDLREMIAALKIVSVVERIGDYAKNIAKRVALMDPTRSIEAIPVLTSMSSLVADLVHDALDSFAAREADLAVRVTVRDTAVYDFYNRIFPRSETRRVGQEWVHQGKSWGMAVHLKK